jgi:outer membrane protein assembly factor BamC
MQKWFQKAFRFNKKNGQRYLLIAGLMISLSACSSLSEDEGSGAKTLPPLDVPPDLIKPYKADKIAEPVAPQAAGQTKECSCDETPAAIGQAVLPPTKGVQRLRDGKYRWLQVHAEPEEIWPLARKFLEMRGYKITLNEPTIGLMETDWKNRFDNGAGEGDSNSRERLRIRLERAQQPEYTEVYFTQYNEERSASSSKGGKQSEQWQIQSPDNERAIEMLSHFAQYLAAENVEDAGSRAPLVSKLTLEDGEGTVLVVEAGFDKVWRRTGIALDALGFVIDDSDRASRTYRVSHELPSEKTEEEQKFGKPETPVKEKYQLQLDKDGDKTKISIRDQRGDIDGSDEAVHVLNLLRGQFQ